MAYKALKNFHCNGVKKKPGQTLSVEDEKKMGDKHLQEHVKQDLLVIESPAPKAPNK